MQHNRSFFFFTYFWDLSEYQLISDVLIQKPLTGLEQHMWDFVLVQHFCFSRIKLFYIFHSKFKITDANRFQKVCPNTSVTNEWKNALNYDSFFSLSTKRWTAIMRSWEREYLRSSITSMMWVNDDVYAFQKFQHANIYGSYRILQLGPVITRILECDN